MYERNGGSFRDPNGYVLHHNKNVYRVINTSYQEEYDYCIKSGLYKILNENETLKNTYFGFALVTGTGRIDKYDKAGQKAIIRAGEYKELHTVLCGLAEKNASSKPYVIKIVANPKFKDKVPETDTDDDAAKVFYDLSIK